MTEVNIDKKFEVYDIDWIIDDVSLATCGDNWSIPSPEFTVTGFHETKWLIVLTPTSYKKQPDSVVFALKRCTSNGGPKIVYVEWRLTISVSGCNEAITVERLCGFGVGTEYKENLKGLKNTIDMIKPFESDLMTVRCRMIIYDKASKEKFEPCNDKTVRLLSQDLLNLFLSRNGCDLALKIGHKVILAHKAIVCTRIPKLSQLLGDSNECNEIDTVDLPNLHYEATIKIMQYVYSGNLSYVLCEPSLDICNDVQVLDVKYLKEFFHSKELSFRTSMNAQESMFTWDVRGYFELYDCLLKSPPFSDDCSTTWRLIFYIAEENPFNYSSIFAEYVGEAELGNMCIEFAITNEYGGTVYAKWLRRAASDPVHLGFGKFIRRNMVRNFVTKNTLRLTMKLKLPSCEMRSYIKKQYVELVTNSHKVGSFDFLVEDMQTLCYYSDFSDLFFENKEESFGIHKSIATARCSYFLSLPRNEENETNSIKIPETERNILRMLLEYVYVGDTPESSVGRQEIFQLRETAKAFNLPLLENICAERMKETQYE